MTPPVLGMTDTGQRGSAWSAGESPVRTSTQEVVLGIQHPGTVWGQAAQMEREGFLCRETVEDAQARVGCRQHLLNGLRAAGEEEDTSITVFSCKGQGR